MSEVEVGTAPAAEEEPAAVDSPRKTKLGSIKKNILKPFKGLKDRLPGRKASKDLAAPNGQAAEEKTNGGPAEEKTNGDAAEEKTNGDAAPDADPPADNANAQPHTNGHTQPNGVEASEEAEENKNEGNAEDAAIPAADA